MKYRIKLSQWLVWTKISFQRSFHRIYNFWPGFLYVIECKQVNNALNFLKDFAWNKTLPALQYFIFLCSYVYIMKLHYRWETLKVLVYQHFTNQSLRIRHSILLNQATVHNTSSIPWDRQIMQIKILKLNLLVFFNY